MTVEQLILGGFVILTLLIWAGVVEAIRRNERNRDV